MTVPGTIMNSTRVTEDQLHACTRHIDGHGHPFYEVHSATEPDVTYIVRWHGYRAVDNCKSGRIGVECWHCRAATLSEKIYQGMVNPDEVAATRHELEQLALDGFKCYEPRPFSLLK